MPERVPKNLERLPIFIWEHNTTEKEVYKMVFPDPDKPDKLIATETTETTEKISELRHALCFSACLCDLCGKFFSSHFERILIVNLTDPDKSERKPVSRRAAGHAENIKNHLRGQPKNCLPLSASPVSALNILAFLRILDLTGC